MTEVHKRGGVVFEVLTGLKSSSLADHKQMNDDTVRMLRKTGKLLPAARRGAKPKEWPSIEIRDRAFAIWTDTKNIPSDAAARRLVKPLGVTDRMMMNFGPSGRNKT